MRWAVLPLLLLSLAPRGHAQDKPRLFRAGAYAQDITAKKYPISVNGGMTDRQAKGAHDPLHARCLVLDDGTMRIAFVVVDSCMIPRDVCDNAKRLAQKATGIPPDRILISATHTHTAPTLSGVFQSEPDEDYRQYLAEKIAAGLARAVQNLTPAKIGWGIGHDATQVFNRRWLMANLQDDPFGKKTDQVKMNPGYQHKDLIKPAGPIDPEVSVVSVQSAKGRPLALLANYSLHYVGGAPPLSADYFGAFAERIKELLGADQGDPPFVGILSNGTSGDINNINFAGPAPPKNVQAGEKMRLVADSVAGAALAAYRKIKHQDRVELGMAQKEIELGVRRPSEADLIRAREILKKAEGKKVLGPLSEVYARETMLLAGYPPKVKLVLQAIRIGELGIVAIPCETFVEIGLEIKQKSPLRPTFTIELANGYNGYLPTPKHHALGGYETWRARSSYLEVQASQEITATLLDLLATLSHR